LGCAVSFVSATAQYLKQQPPKIINKTVTFAVAIPSDMSMEIVQYNVSFKDIRLYGRTIGDDILGPLSLGVGLALTILPEQLENIDKGADISEFIVDGVIDGGGFAVSEMAGDALAAVSAPFVGPAMIGVMYVVDIGVGVFWDSTVGSEASRSYFTNLPNDVSAFNQYMQNPPQGYYGSGDFSPTYDDVYVLPTQTSGGGGLFNQQNNIR
jgi:hypothetical protein